MQAQCANIFILLYKKPLMLDKYIIAETSRLFSLFSFDTQKAVRLSAYRPIVCICKLLGIFFSFS